MKKSELGKSGILVSGLSLGTWAFAGGKVWGSSDECAAIDTIHYALEHGVNLVDTAERYGDGKSEEIVGLALKGRRTDAVLATKVYTEALHYDDVIAHCEASLKRMQTDYIDLYQVHWPNPEIPLEETYGAFEDLKKAGKIRASGICNAGETCVQSLDASYDIAMNQLPYSLLWRIAEKKIIPATEKSGIYVWAYSPLAQGLLTGKFRSVEDVPLGRRETRFYSGAWKQGRHNDPGFEKEIFSFIDFLVSSCEETGYAPAEIAMGFLKRRKIVKSILVGARSPGQLQQNIASYEREVPDDLMDEIEKASNDLKEIMGENADMWVGNGGRFF